MKKFILELLLILGIISIASISFATNEDTTYLYTNESGDLVSSDTNELDDDAILIDGEEEYQNLYNNFDDAEEQKQLQQSFEEQKSKLNEYKEEEKNTKFIVSSVISDVKTQYISNYSSYYVVQYQVVNIKTDEKESPAVVILAYDVSINKSIKPLKAGDTFYGFVEYVSKTDGTYQMVNHGLTDDEIAYVSISSQDRTLGIVLLSIFTILLLTLYAGKHGAKLLIPLFVAIDLLFVVLVPELEIGKNIILYASLIALEFIILIAVLKNGWSRKTVIAILSSIIITVLITVLGYAFGNANGLTGKGIVSEENYDLFNNVYYIDSIMKETVGTWNVYISILILISSVLSVTVSSRITELSEKYAGSDGMVNSIIEEAKPMIADYPMIITIIFLVLFLPKYMALQYNHLTFSNFINAESLVTYLAIMLLSVISLIIASPVTAIMSYLFMGKVEVKQIASKE